jgi:transposase InsO family protein
MKAALALLDHVGRFGAPVQLLSDRGSHFVNETISEFLTLIGTEHCLTIAYSKEESALVERQNREVNRHLRAMIFDRAVIDDYKLAVPLVRRSLNTHVSFRTGISAADLLFGQLINSDRNKLLRLSQMTVDVPRTQMS